MSRPSRSSSPTLVSGRSRRCAAGFLRWTAARIGSGRHAHLRCSSMPRANVRPTRWHAIRNSFLRGISDEFISPIVVEQYAGCAGREGQNWRPCCVFQPSRRHDAAACPVRCRSRRSERCKADDRDGLPDRIRSGFNLPAAFRPEPEKNTLTEVFAGLEIPNFKITESARFRHLTYFFDGGADRSTEFEQQCWLPTTKGGCDPAARNRRVSRSPTSSSGHLESYDRGVFVVKSSGRRPDGRDRRSREDRAAIQLSIPVSAAFATRCVSSAAW